MTRAPRPVRTTTDTVLVGLVLAGLVASTLVQVLDGPDAVAAVLTATALVAGLWAAWRWYDREPDGRRGE